GGRGGGGGGGGGVVRFIQRDLDAAELMIRARKLDLAAREWVGVRCLLLKRATASAAAAAAAAAADDDDVKKSRATRTLVLRPMGATAAAAAAAAAVAASSPSEASAAPPGEEKSGRTSGATEAAAAAAAKAHPSELDSVLEALPGDAGLVVENPEEADAVPGSSAGYVGVGWGGWDSSRRGDEKRYLAQAHTQDFLAGVMAVAARGGDGGGGAGRGGSGAWPMASASAACVVRGVSAVLSGRCTNALCLLPETSGRHAPSGGYSVGGGKGGRASGLPCSSVNSVAVGALYAHMQWAVGRVAVVDLDAHLATGTADILCRTLDPAFLYATIAVDDGGSATSGLGTHDHALRLLAEGKSGGGDASKQLTRATLEGVPGHGDEIGGGGGGVAVLAAALEAFRPDLVMISAGLDGRKGHPCGRGDLVAADYEWLTLEV
ncbi:unnamed protein product, partial [Hapterophycus canaliculatus]